MKNKEPDINSIYSEASKAIEDWIAAKCLGKDLKNTIYTMLDKSLQEIVASAMGLTNEWGKWKIDRCNGREPIIATYISEKAGAVVYQWLDKQIGNLLKFTLSKEQKKSLKEEAKSAFYSALRGNIRRLAQEKAQDTMKEMLSKIQLDKAQLKDATKALEFVELFSKVAVPEEDEKQ